MARRAGEGAPAGRSRPRFFLRGQFRTFSDIRGGPARAAGGQVFFGVRQNATICDTPGRPTSFPAVSNRLISAHRPAPPFPNGTKMCPIAPPEAGRRTGRSGPLSTGYYGPPKNVRGKSES